MGSGNAKTNMHQTWIKKGWGGGGGAGGPNPMNDQKNIGFLSKAGPDPMKNHRAAEPTFIVGSSSTRQ